MMGKYTPYEKYRDSGIGWLGEVPEHWEVRKAKYLFSLVCEQAPANNDYELLSIYTAIGVRPRRDLEARGNKATTTDNYWIVKKKDIIVNKLLAWMGAIGISEFDGVTSPAYDILRSKNDVNPYFYNYLFRSPLASSEFKKNSTGIMDVRLRLYFSELGNIYFPHPSFEEQTAIARFLDYKLSKINRFIRKKKQLIRLLNEQKAAIINQAVTKGLDPHARMKDSGVEWLGEIPEHWEVRKLKYVAEVNTGKTPKIESSLVDYFIDGDINWFTPGDFKEEGILNKSSRSLNNKAFDDSQVTLFPKNTIYLVGIGGTIGKVGISFTESSCNQQINALVFNKNIKPSFAFYFLKSQKHQVELLADFTTLPILNQSKNKEIVFSIPPLPEQHQIVTHIETETALLTTAISKIEKEIALVEEYKTALIAEAVTGKIDVRGYVVPEMDVETWHAMSPEEEEELSMAAEDAAEYQTEETK